MPRPKTKSDLLEQSQKNYERLIELIESLSPKAMYDEFPPGYLNRNIRDVIAHLYEWHTMVMHWYEVGKTGAKPDIPAKGYTWKTTPDLNRAIQEKYSDTTFEEAIKLFNGSHQQMMNLIEGHTDEELFEKKRYKWTGTTSLGAYLISCTSSHYDWALKLIKKCRKAKAVNRV